MYLSFEEPQFKKVVKASIDLERWAQAAHVPSFDEYMEVGEEEITVTAALACIFMSMENIDWKEAYEWLKSKPKLAKAVTIKGRLMNDLTGFEDDMSRGYVTNAVNCYMTQNGVTKEEAFKKLYKMVEMADKTINEEFLTNVGVEREVLKAAIDLSRMIQLTYNVDEGLTNPEGKIMEYMTSLFIDHIRL